MLPDGATELRQALLSRSLPRGPRNRWDYSEGRGGGFPPWLPTAAIMARRSIIPVILLATVASPNPSRELQKPVFGGMNRCKASAGHARLLL